MDGASTCGMDAWSSPILLPLSSAPRSNRRRWWALVVVCLAMFMNALDSSIVNVALPAIQKDLHFTAVEPDLGGHAFLITFGSFLLMAGRLGDLIGRRKVFLCGIVLFTSASVMCGVAQSQAVLIAGRFLQGIGGAFSASVIIAIIVTEFPEHGRAQPGHECLHLRGGGRRVHRAARRRRTDPGAELALDLLHQRAHRRLHLPGRSDPDRRERRARHPHRGGRGRIGSGHFVPDARDLRHLDGHRVPMAVRCTPSGFGGASAALLVAFFVLESRLANPIMPAADPADPDPDPVQHHPGHAGHGHVHYVLPRRPLPRGRAGVQPRSRPVWPSCRCRSPWGSCRPG